MDDGERLEHWKVHSSSVIVTGIVANISRICSILCIKFFDFALKLSSSWGDGIFGIFIFRINLSFLALSSSSVSFLNLFSLKYGTFFSSTSIPPVPHFFRRNVPVLTISSKLFFLHRSFYPHLWNLDSEGHYTNGFLYFFNWITSSFIIISQTFWSHPGRYIFLIH